MADNGAGKGSGPAEKTTFQIPKLFQTPASLTRSAPNSFKDPAVAVGPGSSPGAVEPGSGITPISLTRKAPGSLTSRPSTDMRLAGPKVPASLSAASAALSSLGSEPYTRPAAAGPRSALSSAASTPPGTPERLPQFRQDSLASDGGAFDTSESRRRPFLTGAAAYDASGPPSIPPRSRTGTESALWKSKSLPKGAVLADAHRGSFGSPTSLAPPENTFGHSPKLEPKSPRNSLGLSPPSGKRMSHSSGVGQRCPQLSLDPFVMRQFGTVDPSFTGQRIDCPPQEFEDRINALYDQKEHEVRDGHAPFCKHIFVPNFIENLMPSVVEITPGNKDKLRSSYEQRSANDLAVLVRWFLLDESCGLPPTARYLEIIVYHKSQVATMGMGDLHGHEPTTRMGVADCPWRVVSIKGQDTKEEIPLQPVTMMRNALPRAAGGCDFPLDAQKYNKSVIFWETHCMLRAG